MQKQSRNSTPAPAATSSLPPQEIYDPDYLNTRLILFANLNYDDLVDHGASNATVPDSKTVDTMLEKLKSLTNIMEKRSTFYDRGMRHLLDERKNRPDDFDRMHVDGENEGKKSKHKRKKGDGHESDPSATVLPNHKLTCLAEESLPWWESKRDRRSRSASLPASPDPPLSPLRLHTDDSSGEPHPEATSVAPMRREPQRGPSTMPAHVDLSTRRAVRPPKELKVPLIHELAISDQSTEHLRRKWVGQPEVFIPTLQTVAEYHTDAENWSMKRAYWKELDVWKYDYDSQEQRQMAIERAIRRYDSQRLAAAEPEWQKLLEEEDRGKGICLSRLHASLAEGRPSMPDMPSAEHATTSYGWPGQFQCKECYRSFSSSENLEKHMQRHTRPFRCDHAGCNRATDGFSTANDLARHKASVHGEAITVYKYDAGFGSGMGAQRRLHTHLCSHADCIASTHGFSTATDLAWHKTSVHGETPASYKCTHGDCAQVAAQRIYSRKDDFRAHLLLEHGLDISSSDADAWYQDAGPRLDANVNKPHNSSSLFGDLTLGDCGLIGGQYELPGYGSFAIDLDANYADDLYNMTTNLVRNGFVDQRALEGAQRALEGEKAQDCADGLSAGIDSSSGPRSPRMPHLHPVTPMEAQQATQPTADAPYTDFGYTSMSVLKPENVPSTDSGYASLSAMKGHDPRRHEDHTATESARDADLHNDDDTRTEYSHGSSATSAMQEDYIEALADDLFQKIGPLHTDQQPQSQFSTLLSELLQAFAIKVGHNASTPMHRDVMTFVHKHRHEIAAALTKAAFKQDEDDAQPSPESPRCMSLLERMSLWEKNKIIEDGAPEKGPDDSHGNDDADSQAGDETGMEEVPDSRLRAYRSFIPTTDAYEWLLSRLRREYSLAPTEPNAMQEIRAAILSSLPTNRRVSRKTPSQSVSAKFELDWDIAAFLEMQGYPGRPDKVFEGVITITGSRDDAQAATCAQYLRQTWPLTGDVMIQLMKKVFRGIRGYSSKCELSDGTTLTADITQSKFVVWVWGVAVSVAEAGEQLAWLGAALRAPSHGESGLVLCVPLITSVLNEVPRPPRKRPHSEDTLRLSTVRYKIGAIVDKVLQPLATANGQCWHDMFRNPVIVGGYPIPRRPQRSTGLEIPLNIMAGLTQSRRVDQFDDKTYIKGFSTMLIPTRLIENVICWHLVYNNNGDRISYLDGDVHRVEQIGHLNVEDYRHVLGWCSEANVYAGSKLADQTPVGHSRLPKPHAGCALAKKLVFEGKVISSGPEFHLGDKDRPVRLSQSGYIPRLHWLSTKFVLLWDERDKRGWLVNGTSALLHLVRASLAHDKNGDFASACLFKRLEESHSPGKATSAIHVLINRTNLDLKLHREKDSYILLESRIDSFCNVLEKLIDHQVKMANDPDVKWNDRPRGYLEGWEFQNLARRRDAVHPRVATLEAGGKSWVDFTRAIQAVTLVGSGFGDIIRPAATDVCHHWATLPTKQYYIACCLPDLRDVIEEHGRRADGHVQLGDDLIWHTPTTMFETCRCKRDADGEDRCEPVQTIFPLALVETLGRRKQTYDEECADDGALIFGHNLHFSWVWGDTGDPQEGILGEATASFKTAGVDSDSLHDSGIGSIISEESTSSFAPLFKSPSNTTLNPAAPFDDGPYPARHYTVGILCALPKELMAVRALLDRAHSGVCVAADDSNQYAFGRVGRHMVVTACLPASEYGTNSAAAVAANMVRSFPSVRFCLLVGIGGGVPLGENDVRLGDVVVSLPSGSASGVVQYDLGKEKDGSPFELTGTLQRPPRVLATAISAMRSDPCLRANPLRSHLEKITSIMPEYGYPGQDLDVLQTACAACTLRKKCPLKGCHVRQRTARPTAEPMIHYGVIASGNRLIKDASFRDKVAKEVGALCFEMEAAGVVNTVSCLVIRGICDYCDAHKNDVWQNYAAATAAAYAKVLLSVVGAVDDGAGVGKVTQRRTVEFDPWDMPRKRQRH